MGETDSSLSNALPPISPDIPPVLTNPHDPHGPRDPAPGAYDVNSLITAVRWATTTVGLLWAVALHTDSSTLGLGGVLLTHAIWRTFRRVDYQVRNALVLAQIVTELVLTLGIVVASNCWESPYMFALFTPVIAAAFASGFWTAFRIVLVEAITVGLAAVLTGATSGIRPATSWSGELLLTAAVAGYGQRLFQNAQAAGAVNLNQLWRLNEANTLLMSLNRLSRDLPASFDFHETLSNAIERARDATRPDVSALLLLDPLTAQWNVAMSEGSRLPDAYSETTLPEAIQSVAHKHSPHILNNLSPQRQGLARDSSSGLYVPLWAGGRQIGLLAVEACERGHFGRTELDLLNSLSEAIALTVDNARWFERLRARGAAQERNRIARDMHDRVGQGVAYLAFELDRLSSRASTLTQDALLEDELLRLRTDARSIVHELRETLYDLRTDVSNERDLAQTIQEFLERVGRRSSLQTHFLHDGESRLPLAHERETWRIAQEAIVNAERHAQAQNIEVEWHNNGRNAQLVVRDDGVGINDQRKQGNDARFAASPSPRGPSYGITGMRERADVLRARLDVEAAQPRGTIVRLTIDGVRIGTS